MRKKTARRPRRIPRARTNGAPNIVRSERDPFDRHLTPDLEVDTDRLDIRTAARRRAFFRKLPRVRLTRSACRPKWNSIVLFFNFTNANRPGSYKNTTVQAAKNWLDEGTDPASPGISEFMCRYWSTLSYGKLVFGVNTPRSSTGSPLVPTIAVPAKGANDWGEIIKTLVKLNAYRIWQAAGGLKKDGKRWIPSVVLVQNYSVHATAHFGGYDLTVGGKKYRIGDRTHLGYSLKWLKPSDYGMTWNDFAGTTTKLRKFWGTLCHEYAHNFLEFGDLYGPPGCTGYWDLLGDNSPPGRMSEVSSVHKVRIGWMNFKSVIKGPMVASREMSLRPYSSTGEAYKVIPDPKHNPHEYFVLEYRKKIGNNAWQPDGALPEEGLLILHYNDRLGIPKVWLMRDAPYFDEELADYSDNGGTQWLGHKKLRGVLYPQGYRKHFTRWTQPSSDLYGSRPSGLSITNIRVSGGRVRFKLGINLTPRVGWNVSTKDRALAGSFTNESTKGGQELFIRDGDNAALMVHRQGQWHVVRRQEGWIGGWNLGKDSYEVVGDLDGDGKDEIYMRSPNWAGVLKWERGAFRSKTVQHDWVDRWNLGADNRELAADVDGDGKDEIYVRSPDWAGVIKLAGNRLRLQSIQHDRIGAWNLGRKDQEWAGKFTQTRRDEILVRSAEWIGLFEWDRIRRRLRLKKIQHDWVDGWNMGGKDRHAIGDFDGDGRDEIYIRSDKWAGVIKWKNNRFRLLWIRKNDVQPINTDWNAIPLQAGDASYAGRFMPKRDGILHRNGNSVAVLTWESGQMKIRHHLKSKFNGRWSLGSKDRFVVGDFHRLGRDVADPVQDHIQDGMSDVFIHNGWGTGMVGVNHSEWNPNKPGKIRSEIGLTWINQKEVLCDD